MEFRVASNRALPPKQSVKMFIA